MSYAGIESSEGHKKPSKQDLEFSDEYVKLETYVDPKIDFIRN